MREKESPRRSGTREKPRPPRPLTPDDLAGDGPKMPRKKAAGAGLPPKPSQAEGDRETVEEDLRAKRRLLEREERAGERRVGERRVGERREAGREG